jgi:ketosteroid isomerase-like protein
MSTATPQEVFEQVVDGISSRRYAGLPDLYAEQTDVRHPLSPYGDKPLLSRDDLREHFGGAAAQAAATVEFSAQHVVVHQTTDPEVIVAEWRYDGTTVDTGESFSAPCIIVMRVRDGQIVESRDYIDHITMARARGQLDSVVAAIREPRG